MSSSFYLSRDCMRLTPHLCTHPDCDCECHRSQEVSGELNARDSQPAAMRWYPVRGGGSRWVNVLDPKDVDPWL